MIRFKTWLYAPCGWQGCHALCNLAWLAFVILGRWLTAMTVHNVGHARRESYLLRVSFKAYESPTFTYNCLKIHLIWLQAAFLSFVFSLSSFRSANPHLPLLAAVWAVSTISHDYNLPLSPSYEEGTPKKIRWKVIERCWGACCCLGYRQAEEQLSSNVGSCGFVGLRMESSHQDS